MKRPDLAEFKNLLLRRRAQLAGDMESLADETLRKSRQDAAGDLSKMPIHWADVSGDNFEKELNLDFMQMESAELRSIDEALARIEQKTFGTCQTCGKSITKTRLRAVPYARLCIGCQREEEEGQS